MKFANNRTEHIINLAETKKNHNVLTVGVSNVPEIEKIIENKIKECYCIDIDSDKIKNARTHLKKTKLIIGDINSPKKEFFGKFDTIIMLEVLEHLKEDYKMLKKINKMLKKRGKLIITVPNKHFLHIFNPLRYTQHYRHYNMKELTTLLKKTGFSIKYSNTVESPKLLINLYMHLFCKFILRKKIRFGVLGKNEDKTYLRLNKESRALDCLVVATKN